MLLLSLLMCRGTHAGHNGMLAPESNISIEFCHVNMTGSDMAQGDNAFYVQRRGPHHDLDYSLCPFSSPVCADQKIMLTGLLSVQITDFTYFSRSRSGCSPTSIVISLSKTLPPFILWPSSATTQLSSDRVVYKESDISAIGHLT
jgi:hypothetical protein